MLSTTTKHLKRVVFRVIQIYLLYNINVTVPLVQDRMKTNMSIFISTSARAVLAKWHGIE